MEILAINYAMEMSPMIDHYIASLNTKLYLLAIYCRMNYLRKVVIESKYAVVQLFGALVWPYHDEDADRMLF